MKSLDTNIDPQLKKDVEAILKSLGSSRDDAIKRFYEKIKEQRTLTFLDTNKILNADSLEAFKELGEGKGTKYNTFEDFKKSVEEDVKNC